VFYLFQSYVKSIFSSTESSTTQMKVLPQLRSRSSPSS